VAIADELMAEAFKDVLKPSCSSFLY